MTLSELASHPALARRAGAKAMRLARLVAAGLPVPPGYVVFAGDEIPTGAMGLSTPLVVRSSSTAEDSETSAAPGLFESVRDVTADQVADAIAKVRASARTPAVAAYAEARGLDVDSISMAVLIQTQVAPQSARGTAYTDPVESTLIEQHRDGLALSPGDAGFSLDESMRQRVVALCADAAAAAGIAAADVEWVVSGAQVWIVQVRPISAPRPKPATLSPDSLAFSRQAPDRIWHLDVGHNPDPLSPAQAALVDIVADLAPQPMRVVDGYLYAASGHGALPGTIDLAALWQIWEHCTTQIDAVLTPLEHSDAVSIAEAVAAYRRVFEIYMKELTPALDRARHVVSSDATTAAAASVVAESPWGRHAGSLSTAWDVAAPTFDETGATPPPAIESAEPPRTLGAAVAVIANADDVLFYRAQSVVRRAMLAVARRWNIDPIDDIFYFPFVAELRATRERQRALIPPLAFANGRPLALVASRGEGVWIGRGGGGVARGRVVRVGDLGAIDAPTDGAVVVARSLTPAMVVMLSGAAAVVSEHGGLLGHAAAMARELGVPYVVGCVGPWLELTDDDVAIIDGDRGLVVRVARARIERS